MLEAAEESLGQGTPAAVITVLDNSIRAKVSERYQGVLDARAAEAANKTIETSRERVEAELMFEKVRPRYQQRHRRRGGARGRGARVGDSRSGPLTFPAALRGAPLGPHGERPVTAGWQAGLDEEDRPGER